MPGHHVKRGLLLLRSTTLPATQASTLRLSFVTFSVIQNDGQETPGDGDGGDDGGVGELAKINIREEVPLAPVLLMGAMVMSVHPTIVMRNSDAE